MIIRFASDCERCCDGQGSAGGRHIGPEKKTKKANDLLCTVRFFILEPFPAASAAQDSPTGAWFNSWGRGHIDAQKGGPGLLS